MCEANRRERKAMPLSVSLTGKFYERNTGQRTPQWEEGETNWEHWTLEKEEEHWTLEEEGGISGERRGRKEGTAFVYSTCEATVAGNRKKGGRERRKKLLSLHLKLVRLGCNFFTGSCTLVLYVQGFLILYFSGKQVGKQMHFNNDKTYLDSAAERSHSRCFKFITDIRTSRKWFKENW